MYCTKSALKALNNNKKACLEIIELLKIETPKYRTQLETADYNIKTVREIIHGMIGAFHYTGAESVKAQLIETQNICKDAKSDHKHAINILINNLKSLEDYLNNNKIEF